MKAIQKKWMIFAFCIILGSSVNVPSAHAVSDGFGKMGRGVTNILLCWTEVFRHIGEQSHDHDPATALVGGTAKGLLYTVGRAAGGVLELATFPIPIPKDYEPLMEPPTPFEF